MKKSDIGRQVHFSRNKKYSITNLKTYVRIKKDVTKWNDYDKIVELSNFWRKLIAKYETGIGLKEVALASDQRRFTKGTVSRITSYKIFKVSTILNINFMKQ